MAFDVNDSVMCQLATSSVLTLSSMALSIDRGIETRLDRGGARSAAEFQRGPRSFSCPRTY